jgi:hypothetical protein
MSYTVKSVTAPSTPTVGEPFTIEAEYCSVDETNRDTEARLYFDGSEIGSKTLVHGGAFCSTFTSGQHIFRQPPPGSGPGYELSVDRFGGGPITVTEPGVYDVTLSIVGGGQITETVEVVEPVIDPGLVTTDCSITAPESPSPGDTVTLEATVTNDNTEAVDVEVEFTFGSASETQTVTVPNGASETVTQAFTPDETGEFVPDVNHTIL